MKTQHLPPVMGGPSNVSEPQPVVRFPLPGMVGKWLGLTTGRVAKSMPYAVRPSSLMIVTGVGSAANTVKLRHPSESNPTGYSYPILKPASSATLAIPANGTLVLVHHYPSGPIVVGTLSA